MATPKIIIEKTKFAFPDSKLEVCYNVSSYFPVHTHEDFWEIVVFLKDCREYFNGRIRHCKAYDCCIIRPQDVHAYPDKSEEIILYNLKITSVAFKRLLDNFDSSLYDALVTEPQPLIPLAPETAKRILNKLSALSVIPKLNNRAIYIRTMIAYMIEECILFPNLVKRNLPDSVVANDPLSALISRLSLPKYLEGDLADLTAGLGYSEGHLSRMFKQAFGMTIGAYFLDAKITYSASLLAHSDQSIIQIANTVGYANQSNFGKVFKRKFGISPLAYRKSTPPPLDNPRGSS